MILLALIITLVKLEKNSCQSRQMGGDSIMLKAVIDHNRTDVQFIDYWMSAMTYKNLIQVKIRDSYWRSKFHISTMRLFIKQQLREISLDLKIYSPLQSPSI